MKMWQLLLITCFSFEFVKSYKILGVFSVPSHSHYSIGHSLLKGLAENGHNVTMISPFKENKPIRNYNEVILESFYENFDQSEGNFQRLNNQYFWNMALNQYDMGYQLTKTAAKSRNLQNFIKIDQQFDVIIVDIYINDAFLGFGHHYNAPIIVVSSFVPATCTTDLVGVPNFASYMPYTMNPYSDRMSFWQRIYNSLSFWFEDFAFHFDFIPKQQQIFYELFPNASKTLKEIRQTVSLVLTNTHTSIVTPRLFAPNMIEVGGIQIQQEIKTLHPKTQQFLDEAENGAIFVSFGSNVKFETLLKDQLDAIKSAFAAHSKLRILIKSNEPISIPSQCDVLTEPWFSQHSILAHAKIKLFITHGGMLSITEAVHFAKPIVGVPFFADQHMNIKVAEEKGIGISVPIETLNRQNLANAVNEILTNDSYTKKVKLVSEQYHDKLNTPLEVGMHWVKHVAKNKGAPHLRNIAVDLPLYKLYNLDVWTFILSFLILTAFLLTKSLKMVLRFVHSTSKSKKE